MSWKAGSVPQVMSWAERTTFWRAIQLRVVQLPYQAVMQPERKLLMVHLLKFVRVLGALTNVFSLLRLKRHCCAFFTTVSVEPFQVLGDVHAKELEAFDPLHCGPVDVDGDVLSLLSPLIHNQLLCFIDNESHGHRTIYIDTPPLHLFCTLLLLTVYYLCIVTSPLPLC